MSLQCRDLIANLKQCWSREHKLIIKRQLGQARVLGVLGAVLILQAIVQGASTGSAVRALRLLGIAVPGRS